MADPKANPPKSTTAAESGAKTAPVPEPPVKPIEGNRPDQGLPAPERPQGPGKPPTGGGGYGEHPNQDLPPFATRLPVFPDVPPEPGPEEPPEPQPVKPKLGDRFEVKWTVRYGFILVPVSAEPK